MKTVNVVEGINSGIKWVHNDGVYSLMDDEQTYVTISGFRLSKLTYSIQEKTFELGKKRMWSGRYKILDRSGFGIYEYKQRTWSLKGDLIFHNGKQYQLKFENSPIFSISVYAAENNTPILSYGQAIVGKTLTQYTVKSGALGWNEIELLHMHAFAFWMFKKLLGSSDGEMFATTLLLSAS